MFENLGNAFAPAGNVSSIMGAYQRAPQMRTAPNYRPPSPMMAPQMRAAPVRRPSPQGPIMGMYGGGMGSGPLGRTFMQSHDMGANWQATNQGPQSGGWRQTITDPQGNGWMR